MSALQKVLYKHMQQKGILLTDGSEKDKKVFALVAIRNYLILSCKMLKNGQTLNVTILMFDHCSTLCMKMLTVVDMITTIMDIFG